MTDSAKEAFVGRQIQDFTEIPSQLPFVSDGKAVFYAGSKDNWKKAELYAEKNNMKPVQLTRGGQLLLKMGHTVKDKIDADRVQDVWKNASRKYAASMKGDVKTFVGGATRKSIYRKVELPAVLNNKNVQKINGVDRARIDQMRRDKFNRFRQEGMDRRQAVQRANDAAHRKVAIAEIRQDMKAAQSSQNQTDMKDAQRRLDAIRECHRDEQKQKVEQQQKQEASKKAELDRQQKTAETARADQAKRTAEQARSTQIEATQKLMGDMALKSRQATAKAQTTQTPARTTVAVGQKEAPTQTHSPKSTQTQRSHAPSQSSPKTSMNHEANKDSQSSSTSHNTTSSSHGQSSSSHSTASGTGSSQNASTQSTPSHSGPSHSH